MVYDHIFADLFKRSRVFIETSNMQFMYDLSYGLLPRHFDSNDDEDKVIYDED